MKKEPVKCKGKFLGYMMVFDYGDHFKMKKAFIEDDKKFTKKPALGNNPVLHGKTSTDNAGGANPPSVNPGKARKK